MGVFLKNYLRETDSGSWEEKYSVTTNADKILVHELTGSVGDVKKAIVTVYYIGSDAIDLTNYNGFPVGTMLHNLQAHTTSEKTGATTWVTSAARA